MKYLIPLLLFTLFFSCKPKSTSTKTVETTEKKSEKVTEKRDDIVITKVPPPADQTAEKPSGEILASYFSATVYAGSTDYYFKDAKGKTIEFRQSNLEEFQTFKMPEGMISSDELEGPPGANPELRGKMFKLTYDANGEVSNVVRAD